MSDDEVRAGEATTTAATTTKYNDDSLRSPYSQTPDANFGDDENAPVTELTMLCCEKCPRAFHAKCCLTVTDMITQDPVMYRMPKGEVRMEQGEQIKAAHWQRIGSDAVLG